MLLDYYDLNVMQKYISEIKESNVTLQQFNELKTEFDLLTHASIINNFDLKLNQRRTSAGVFAGNCDFNFDNSGPIGLPHIAENQHQGQAQVTKEMENYATTRTMLPPTPGSSKQVRSDVEKQYDEREPTGRADHENGSIQLVLGRSSSGEPTQGGARGLPGVDDSTLHTDHANASGVCGRRLSDTEEFTKGGASVLFDCDSAARRMDRIFLDSESKGGYSSTDLMARDVAGNNKSQLCAVDREGVVSASPDVVGFSGSKQVSVDRNMQDCENVRVHLPISPVGTPEPISNTSSLNDSGVFKNSFADLVAEGQWKEETPSQKWTEIQKKRTRNQFVSKKGKATTTDQNSKFRAAELKVPIIIDNVNKEASEKDIFEYIEKKTQMRIALYKITRKVPRDYNAFKLFVPQQKLSFFLRDDLWPVGVTFRRFLENNPNKRVKIIENRKE